MSFPKDLKLPHVAALVINAALGIPGPCDVGLETSGHIEKIRKSVLCGGSKFLNILIYYRYSHPSMDFHIHCRILVLLLPLLGVSSFFRKRFDVPTGSDGRSFRSSRGVLNDEPKICCNPLGIDVAV